MQNSSLNYDKVMKPVTRAVESLKRDKELKRELSGVLKEVNNVESAADKVAELKSVVDEKSYDDKVKLLDALQKACTKAINEVKSLSKSLDKLTEKAKAKSKDGSKDVVNSRPVLEELADGLVAVQEQSGKDLKDLTKWFTKAAKADECAIKVPRDVTDMIAMADTGGRIAMPSDQSFDATITLSYAKYPKLGDLLEKNSREVIGEIGRALKPLKQDVAKAFKVWNSEYAQIEKEFDRPAAEKLFKTINNWFTDKLPVLVDPEFKNAVKQAVKDVCAQDKDLKDAWSDVGINVECDYKNIAEFVLKLPDNPADDATKAIGKGVENLESTQKEYKEAVDSIVENHESVDKALLAVQKKLEEAQKKGGDGQAKFDVSKELDELNKETGELETALKDARKNSSALDKDLGDVKKKVDGSKGALKSNATIDKASFDKLGKTLTESQTALKKQIPDQLSKLDGLVKSIKTQHEAITKLGGRDKAPPKAEDLKKANDALGSVGKDFQKEKANLAKNLKLPEGADKLKSLVDNLKS